MNIELLKTYRDWKKGRVIEVTNDLGRELIVGGYGRDTDNPLTDERTRMKEPSKSKKGNQKGS